MTTAADDLARHLAACPLVAVLRGITPGEISAVGSALLGLSVGESIAWPMPGGVVKVKIEEIVYQPERAGEYHR